MNLHDLYQSGISTKKRRFLKHGMRRVLFKLIRPYLRRLVEEIEGLHGHDASAEMRLNAVRKDMEAMAHRFNTIETGLRAAGESMKPVVPHESKPEAAGDIQARASDLSFSQVGEDRIVAYIFERIGMALGNIKYLDLGTALPVGSNNTYLFYLHGASGCLVDADPACLDEYRRLRPRDMLVHAAVVPEALMSIDKTAEFYRTSDPGWSTISSSHLQVAKALGKADAGTQSIKVPAVSVNDLIKTIGSSGELDLLSIDIEGMDSEVIKEIDFAAIRPKVIVAENKFGPIHNTFSSEIKPYLEENGYMLFASTYVNSIFVDAPVMKKVVF